MLGEWRTVRVFISSTFRDMQAERDYLVKIVFPELRGRLEKYRIHLVDIDLRWGVTRQQAENDRVLDICLDQIRQCRPFFMGILGERYGCIPTMLPAKTLSQYGWIQRQTGKSLTELEMLYGVLNDPSMCDRAFFYLRDPAFISQLSDEQRYIYCESPMEQEIQDLGPAQALARAEERKARLCDLKGRLRQWARVHDASQFFENYPCRWETDHPTGQGQGRLIGLEEFGRHVLENLQQAILEAPELADHLALIQTGKTDELDEELGYHEAFIESRTQIYIGREHLHRQLINYLSDDRHQPLLLVGGSGSGKSAVLARLCQEIMLRQEVRGEAQPLVVPHFIGASPRSTSISHSIRRFCGVLCAHFHLTERVNASPEEDALPEQSVPWQIPDDPSKLPETFRQMVQALPKGARAFFIIDGVNQFDELGGGQEMRWLPRQLPPGVKIIVSCIEEPSRSSKALQALRATGTPEIRVEPLSNTERLEIVDKVPSLSAKSLDPSQIALLLANPATANPLYLLVALEELRGFGSFEKLNDKIRSFPAIEGEEGLNLLFGLVLERLEQETEKETVSTIMSLLASSRSGMSESELSEILTHRLSGEEAQRRSGDMQIILRQLRPYLLRRGNLIDFHHRALWKAVVHKYLNTDSLRITQHRTLGSFFLGKGLSSTRMLMETPYHLALAQAWDELSGVLCDLRFIEARCLAKSAYELRADYELALSRLPPGRAETAEVKAFEEFFQVNHAFLDESLCQAEATNADPVLQSAANWRSGPVRDAGREQAQRISGRFWTSIAPPPLDNPLSTRTLAITGGPWRSVAMDARARLAFTGAANGNVQVWDLAAEQLLHDLHGHTRPVSAVAVSTDGRIGLSGDGRDSLDLFDGERDYFIDIQRETRRRENDKSAEKSGAAQEMTSIEKEKPKRFPGRIIVWSLSTGEQLGILEGHADWITALAITPDGRFAASASYDGSVKVWELESFHCVKSMPACEYPATAIALSEDGSLLAVGSAARSNPFMARLEMMVDDQHGKDTDWHAQVQVWDLAGGRHWHHGHHDTDISGMWISPDKSRIISVSRGTLGRYEMEQAKPQAALFKPAQNEIESLDWPLPQIVSNFTCLGSGDTRVIAGGSSTYRDNVSVVNLVSPGGKLFHTDHTMLVTSCAASQDGSVILSSGLEGSLRLWRPLLAQPAKETTGEQELPSPVRFVAITNDGSRVVASHEDGKISFWDAAGRRLAILQAHLWMPLAILLPPDGRTLVSVAKDEFVCLWDTVEARLLQKLDLESTAAALSNDGKTLALGHRSGKVLLYRFPAMEQVGDFTHHEKAVMCLLFAPDDRILLAGSADNTISATSTATLALLGRVKGHQDVPSHLEVTSMGLLESLSETGELCVSKPDMIGEAKSIDGGFLCCLHSPDGLIFITAHKTVGRYRLSQCSVMASLKSTHTRAYDISDFANGLVGLQPTPDSQFLVGCAMGQSQLLVFDLKTGKRIALCPTFISSQVTACSRITRAGSVALGMHCGQVQIHQIRGVSLRPPIVWATPPLMDSQKAQPRLIRCWSCGHTQEVAMINESVWQFVCSNCGAIADAVNPFANPDRNS
jgi:WD40 repeat protein